MAKRFFPTCLFIFITFIGNVFTYDDEFVIYDQKENIGKHSSHIELNETSQNTRNLTPSEDLIGHGKLKMLNITNHKFYDLFGSGVLPRENLTSFIIQQYFVHDEMLSLWSSMLTDLNTLQEKIKGIEYIATLSSKHTKYFISSIEALNLNIQKFQKSDETKAFIQQIQSLTSSNYKIGDKLAILYPYCLCLLEASERIKRDLVYNKSSYWIYSEWIDMHSSSEFKEIVDYLQAAINSIYKKLKYETILISKFRLTNSLIYQERLLSSFIANST